MFSGVKRKASIAQYLLELCKHEGVGLQVDEIDIHVGGASHDLLSRDAQEVLMARISSGDYDLIILSPPCGTWSRAPWSDNQPPQPVRDRHHPWGFPSQRTAADRRRLRDGNEFIHFSIRAIVTAQDCKRRGRRVMTLMEHPEDLGRVPRGQPASAWQLPELRGAYAEFPFATAAGHQCQFNVDYAKPTRLLSDILTITAFGYSGWPVFDADDRYRGPLPKSCGHGKHGQQMIGHLPGGGFATSPTAAYPPGMCRFLAFHIYMDWMENGNGKKVFSPFGGGNSSGRRREAGTDRAASPTRAPSKPLLFPESSSNDKRTNLDKIAAELSQPEGIMDSSIYEFEWKNEIISQEKIDEATAEANKKGIDRPIREGIDDEMPSLVEEDSNDDEVERASAADGVTSDEEKELEGRRRPKKGEGWWGRGKPLRPTRKGLPRDFVDGGGFPSPGRWSLDQRRLPDDEVAKEIRELAKSGLEESLRAFPGKSIKTAIAALASGSFEKNPFPEEVLDRIRMDIRIILKKAGRGDCLPREGDVKQETEVRLLQGLMEVFGDIDSYFCDWWARGVWLGSPDKPLPRAPALYDRKVKWPKHDESTSLHGEWRANYSSIREHEVQVAKQFREEIEEDMMLSMPLEEAIDSFGEDLLLAATGAIAKKGVGPGGDVRVIFDGTNGVFLNAGIRIRDQVRYPIAADLKVVLAEMAEHGGSYFSLLYDIKKAHRRIPVRRQDWGRQACQVRGAAAASAQAKRIAQRREREAAGFEVGAKLPPLSKRDFTKADLAELVYVNCVGTFGVTSAGYWWGRAGGAILRLTHYVLGYTDMVWALMYSDDGCVMSGNDHRERSLLLHLFVLVILNVPLSWKKVRGGVEAEWIGYLLDLGRFELGVTASRAAWASKWLRDTATEGVIKLSDLREGLGRLQFICGAIEFFRPFLGPLYAWSAAGPRYARPKLPVMIVLIMKYLAEEIGRVRMMPCVLKAKQLGEVYRLDAKAEGDKVVIGGWRTAGGLKTSEAPWFSVALTRSTAPWAFARGEPFRTVASLELMASLIGLMVLVPESGGQGEACGFLGMSCGTDNQGNSFLLDRMLTTKYPLGVVLMELAHQMRVRRLALRAHWLPRLQNEEADALTNDDFRHFDPDRRIQVDIEKMSFGVLRGLFETGEAYISELEKAKAAAAKAKAAGGTAKDTKRSRQAKAVIAGTCTMGGGHSSLHPW